MAETERVRNNLLKMKQGGASLEEMDRYAQFEATRLGTTPKQSDDVGAPVQALAGVNEGIANVLGAPVDIVSSGLSLLGIGDPNEAIGGSAFFKRRLADIGATAPEPDSRAERFARSIGKNVGEGAAALLPVAKAAQVASKASGLTGQVARTVNQGMVRAPGAVVAGDTVAGVAAGVGGEAATEIDPDNPHARMIGEFAGGIGAPLTAAGVGTVVSNSPIVRLATNAAKNATPAGRRAEARKSAARSIGEAASGRSEAAIQDSAAVSGRIAEETGRELDLSLAERTNAPSLVRNQEAIEANMAGADLDRVTARRQGNQQTIDRFAKNVAPGRAATSDELGESFVSARRGRLADIEKADAKLESRERALVQRSLPSEVNVADAGESLRGSIRAARDAKQAEMGKLADELGLNSDADIPFNDAAKELVRRHDTAAMFDKPAETPEVIRILKNVADAPINQNTGLPSQPLMFSDYQSLIRRLGDDHRQALADRNFTLARTLRRLRDDAEELAEGAFAQAGRQDLQDNYRTFRDTYRREFAERFRQGTVSKVLSRTGRGDYLLTDEAVALQFFNQKSVTAARQLQQVLGPQEAAKHIRTAALYDLRAKAVVDGGLDRGRLRSWLARNREALKEYPELARDVASIDKAKETLLRQQAGLRLREKALDDGALNRAIKGIEQGSKSADDIVKSTLEDPRMMRDVLGRLKDSPGARTAFKRKVWEAISQQSGGDVGQALVRHRPALELALSKKHLKDLETIFKAREITSRTTPPRGAREGVPTEQGFKENVGISPQGLANRVLQVKGGFIGGRFAVLDILSRAGYAFDAKQVRALQEQALYDPDVAASLMRAIQSDKVRPKIKVRLRGYLLDSGNDPEPERDTR